MEQLKSMFADVRFVPMPWWTSNRGYDSLRRVAIALGNRRRGATIKASGKSVADAANDRRQRDRLRPRPRQTLLLLGFRPQLCDRSDPHDVALELVVQPVDLQDLVQRLVPGG